MSPEGEPTFETEPPASLETRTREAYDQGESNYWAGFGRPGHEREYVVHVRGYDSGSYMPRGLDDPIKEALGEGWGVMNRGSRIEITYLGDEDGEGSGQPNDDLIEPLLEQIFKGLP